MRTSEQGWARSGSDWAVGAEGRGATLPPRRPRACAPRTARALARAPAGAALEVARGRGGARTLSVAAGRLTQKARWNSGTAAREPRGVTSARVPARCPLVLSPLLLRSLRNSSQQPPVSSRPDQRIQRAQCTPARLRRLSRLAPVTPRHSTAVFPLPPRPPPPCRRSVTAPAASPSPASRRSLPRPRLSPPPPRRRPAVARCTPPLVRCSRAPRSLTLSCSRYGWPRLRNSTVVWVKAHERGGVRRRRWWRWNLLTTHATHSLAECDVRGVQRGCSRPWRARARPNPRFSSAALLLGSDRGCAAPRRPPAVHQSPAALSCAAQARATASCARAPRLAHSPRVLRPRRLVRA